MVENTDPEEWKDVPGWEGYYQVSSLGRVRSVDRAVTQKSRWGIQNRIMRGKLLKLNSCTNKYLFVTLSRPGEKPKAHLVHRLVAFAFHGNPPLDHEVCHTNGIRTDNRSANLRWDSRSSNHRDKLSHGTDSRGEKNSMCKLNTQQILEIRASNLTLKELSKRYEVTEGTLSQIKNFKSWEWL
jgi:hypothetical protein